MATFTKIFLTVTILVVSSSAAPNQELTLKIAEECKGKGFCAIKPEGYDEMQGMIDELLTPKLIAQNIGNRIGGDKPTIEISPESDWHNCPYRKTTEESLYAYSKSNDSDPDYIIQHKLLRQPIEIVECATELINQTSTQQCFGDLGLNSFKMKTRCRSLKSKRSLLVFDYKTKQIRKKSYDVPCCCVCDIIRSD